MMNTTDSDGLLLEFEGVGPRAKVSGGCGGGCPGCLPSFLGLLLFCFAFVVLFRTALLRFDFFPLTPFVFWFSAPFAQVLGYDDEGRRHRRYGDGARGGDPVRRGERGKGAGRRKKENDVDVFCD